VIKQSSLDDNGIISTSVTDKQQGEQRSDKQLQSGSEEGKAKKVLDNIVLTPKQEK
jgi:hypothetical protein